MKLNRKDAYGVHTTYSNIKSIEANDVTVLKNFNFSGLLKNSKINSLPFGDREKFQVMG